MHKYNYDVDELLLFDELMDMNLENEYLEHFEKEICLEDEFLSQLSVNQMELYYEILSQKSRKYELEKICVLRNALKVGKIIGGG